MPADDVTSTPGPEDAVTGVARLVPVAWRDGARPGLRIFSSAADAPRPRRPNDVLTLGLAGVLLLVLVALHDARPGPVDDALQALAAAVTPGILEPIWDVGRLLLVLWPAVLLVVAACSRGRWALVRDGLAAVVVAAGLTAAASRVVDVPWPGLDVFRPGGAADYPSVVLAFSTAVIVALTPHLGRPMRRIGHAVTTVGALGLIAIDASRPSGAVIGVLIGVVAGRAVLVLFGSPGGIPTRSQIIDSLRDLGVRVDDVEPTEMQLAGTYLVKAEDEDGPLVISVCGRDARDADAMARAWRQTWYRAEGPTPTASRLHQVEHEGFVTLLAAEAGIPVPTVVTAGAASTGDALLVTRPVGSPLGPTTPLRDEVAAGFWHLLDRLHGAGVVHGALDVEHLGRTPDGDPCLVSLAGASTTFTEFRVRSDQVQLLATTAQLMGVDEALKVARRHLGDDGLAALLPYLQPAVLSRAARDAPDVDAKDLLEGLSRQITEATETDPPELVKLRRVTWGSLLQAGLLVLAAYALVVGLGSLDLAQVWDDLQTASVPVLIAALIVSQTPRPLQAVSTQGACPKPLPFAPLAALQLAISYINLAVPSAAGRLAVSIRFFQKQGVDRTSALTIGAIDGVGGFVVQALIVILVAATGASDVSLGLFGAKLNIGSAVIIGAVVVVVVAVVVLAVSRRLREWIVDQLRVAQGNLRVLRDPRKLLQLIGGNAASQVLFAVGLALCVRAMGAEVSFIDVLMTNTLVTLFAGIIPVPGGIGVSEAGITAGLAASGVPEETAFAAAICYRVASFYLPPVWGFFAMRWLERRQYL